MNDIKNILWIWKSFGWLIAISQIHYVSIAPKTDWYVHRTTPTHKLKELHIPNIILRIWKTIYSLFDVSAWVFDVSAWVFDARDCILVIIKMICKFIFYLVMNFRQQYFCLNNKHFFISFGCTFAWSRVKHNSALFLLKQWALFYFLRITIIQFKPY